MTSLSYGVLPSESAFLAAVNSEQCGHVRSIDGTFSFGNCKRLGTVELSAFDLWVEVKVAAFEWHEGNEEAGDWASCVLSVLGFEWV